MRSDPALQGPAALIAAYGSGYSFNLYWQVTSAQQPGLSIEAHSDYLNVRPLELAAVDGGRSLELWAIPVEGKPVSLGLIPRDGDGRITLSQTQQQLIRIPVVLAVSLEPQGGSPTGQPTGPVLYQGPLASL